MYTLTHNGNALFDPRIDGFPLQSPVMTLEANKFGTLSFTIFPGHPEYGQIEKLNSLISVYKDDALYMQFRPTYKKQIFNCGFTFKCQDITSRLNDFRFRPLAYSGTKSGFVSAVIASYNARVDTDKQFTVGNITGGTDSFTFKTDIPLGHWDALQTLVNDGGGYILSRYSGGAVYIDYLQDSDLPVSPQAIRYGENMTDMFIETDSDNTFSVLYPLGRNGNSYIDIKSVNGGVDYIESAAGIALYGRRETCITWENVDNAAQLKSLAQAMLDTIAIKFAETVQVSAVDLHNANVSIDSFNFMDLVDCVSTVHGLSHRYVLGSIMIPLGSPDSSDIQLGEKRQSLNDRIILEKKETAAAIENNTTLIYTETERATTAESGLQTTITNTAGQLGARISDAEGNITTLTATTQGLSTRVTNAEGDISTLTQTATGLTTRVTNAEGDISTLQQTATGLTSRVNDAEGDISTLEQTATGISARVTTIENNGTGKVNNTAVLIDGNGVEIKSTGTLKVNMTNFKINSSGNVSVTGAIEATSGSIGKFDIVNEGLASLTRKVTLLQDEIGVGTVGNRGFRATGSGAYIKALYLYDSGTDRYMDVTAAILALL